MENIMILQYKNKYNYTIKQLKINYSKKMFEVGQFKIGADKTVTKKAFNEKIEDLKKINFKNIGEEN